MIVVKRKKLLSWLPRSSRYFLFHHLLIKNHRRHNLKARAYVSVLFSLVQISITNLNLMGTEASTAITVKPGNLIGTESGHLFLWWHTPRSIIFFNGQHSIFICFSFVGCDATIPNRFDSLYSTKFSPKNILQMIESSVTCIVGFSHSLIPIY